MSMKRIARRMVLFFAFWMFVPCAVWGAVGSVKFDAYSSGHAEDAMTSTLFS